LGENREAHGLSFLSVRSPPLAEPDVGRATG
jgi:hypothetical protein